MSDATDGDVILIGASTRAAAMSAVRAGLKPWCVDLFADADLERIATVRKVPAAAYPDGLLTALADMPNAPVIYTGALENRPDLVAQIDRPLWGNAPEVLRAVRSPQCWTQCLRKHNLPCPALAEHPAAGRWLIKPIHGAAGFGIRPYTGQSFHRSTHFLQEWIEGEPVSALFLGRNHGADLLGVTHQLIGTSWLNASAFQYAGNIGPLPLDQALETHWSRIGNALAQSFHLRGLFGVDAILHEGVPWPVEINPRYTASVEVIERATDAALLWAHRSAFDGSAPPALPRPRCLAGKAILYARTSVTFPAAPFEDCADLPHAGDVIEKSRPILTLFASATTFDDCRGKLREKADALDRALHGS